MAVTAAAGVLSFGPQAGKGSVATTFYRHRAVDIDLSILDDVRLGQLEVGGTPIPTFPYKAGVMVGGGATIQPRLKDTLGWLLYGAMGHCVSAETAGGSGMYDHVFDMAADASYVPWMTFRKYIPPKDGILSTDLGEIYKDCKVLGFSLASGTDTPLTSRVDVLGRDFELVDDADDNPSGDDNPSTTDGWQYANTMEDWESIPVACATNGFIKIGGTERPVVAAQVAWQNAPLDPRQEKVIGDPRLEDITIISRQLAFDITVKFNDPQLYRQVLTGNVSGTAWTQTPFTAELDIQFLSSVNMPTEAEPYSIRVQAAKVQLTQQGGLRLAAGQAVMMRFQGVAIEGGAYYAKMTLRNKVASYAWPT